MTTRLLRVAAPACPKCKKRLDEASDTSGSDDPKPGLLTVCCAVLRFTSEMGLEECGDLNPGERAAVDRVIAAIRLIKQRRDERPDLPPPGYVRCVENMLHAAKDFLASHGSEHLLFTLPGKDYALIMPLSAQVIDLLAATEKARDLKLAAVLGGAKA